VRTFDIVNQCAGKLKGLPGRLAKPDPLSRTGLRQILLLGVLEVPIQTTALNADARPDWKTGTDYAKRRAA